MILTSSHLKSTLNIYNWANLLHFLKPFLFLGYNLKQLSLVFDSTTTTTAARRRKVLESWVEKKRKWTRCDFHISIKQWFYAMAAVAKAITSTSTCTKLFMQTEAKIHVISTMRRRRQRRSYFCENARRKTGWLRGIYLFYCTLHTHSEREREKNKTVLFYCYETIDFHVLWMRRCVWVFCLHLWLVCPTTWIALFLIRLLLRLSKYV